MTQLFSKIKTTSALLKNTVNVNTEAPTLEAQTLLTPWQAMHSGDSVNAHQSCCTRCLQQTGLCAHSMCSSCCEATLCECASINYDVPAPGCQQVSSPTMEHMIALHMVTRGKQDNTTEDEESHRQRRWTNQTPPQDYRRARAEYTPA